MDWQKKWADMTDEERTATGIIIEEYVLTHGKCYTVRGRDGIIFTIREDGFVAGKIEIANDKPMTCENFVRMLAEFARAARFFEWTDEDKEKGRNPTMSLLGMFQSWGSVPMSTFAEIPPPEANYGTEGHTEKDSHAGAGQGRLRQDNTRPVCQALPRPQDRVSECPEV
jgi:hypothetical protein